MTCKQIHRNLKLLYSIKKFIFQKKRESKKSLKVKLATIIIGVLIIPIAVLSLLVLPRQIKNQQFDAVNEQLSIIDANINQIFSAAQKNLDFMVTKDLLNESKGNLKSYMNLGEEDDY